MVNNYQPRSRDHVYLDGISLLSFGLVAEMPQPVPIAKQRYTTWQSGDTDFSEPDDSFEDVEYSLTVRKFRSPDDFRNAEFYALAANAKTLIISRHSSRYYRIKRLISITPAANVKGNELIYTITFALAPFAYHSTNPETDLNPRSSVLENPGTRYSKPLYKLTHPHNGDTNLFVNGQVLTINYQASSPIYIDTERMLAHDGSGTNQTQYTSGIYPFLSPGNNLISAVNSGGYTVTLAVTGNWRDY